MAAGILITLREGIEAFLIVGVLIGVLAKIGQQEKFKYIWMGSGAAIALSVALAYVIQIFAGRFEGANALIFELLVAALAIAVLTYMVTWMHKQSTHLKEQMEKKVRIAVSKNQLWALSFLAFVTILREGIETALFLSAVSAANQGMGLMTGAIVGLALAAVMSFLIMKAVVRLNLRRFFLITGSLIVVIAGGLVSHVAGAAQTLGIPLLAQTAWDLSGFIPDEAFLGKLLHAFVGYVAAPTVLQILGYGAYIGAMLRFLWKGGANKPTQRQLHAAS